MPHAFLEFDARSPRVHIHYVLFLVPIHRPSSVYRYDTLPEYSILPLPFTPIDPFKTQA